MYHAALCGNLELLLQQADVALASYLSIYLYLYL